jgi:hypothetical protein
MISTKYKLTMASVIVWLFVLGSYPLLMEPDNYGKVAFISSRDCDREIYVMYADGSNVVKLTRDPGSKSIDYLGDSAPEWSPDGKKIVFSSHKQGNNDIYVMGADGSNVVKLTTSPAHDMHPAWAFDGKKILFSSDRDGNPEIYVMEADGSNQINLTHNPAVDWCPAWCCHFLRTEEPVSSEEYQLNTLFVIIIPAAIIFLIILFRKKKSPANRGYVE